MRQLGTVTDERAAQRFADYLLTKGIGVSVEPDHDGCRLWVRNEDHLEAARREFAEFTASPDAPVYQEAGRAAEQLRVEERRRAKEAKKNFVNVSARGAAEWPGASRDDAAGGGVRCDGGLYEPRSKEFRRRRIVNCPL